MGCFLACFSSSKSAKRRKQRRKVQPRHRRNTTSKTKLPGVSNVEDKSKPIVCSVSVSEIQDKREERFNFNTKNNVTSDSNVRTSVPVLPNEVTRFPPEKSEECGKKEDHAFVKLSQSKSPYEDSSLTSLGSYPPNQRYQNCQDSDGEEEDLDCSDSDICDEDYEDDVSDKEEAYNDELRESTQVITEEVESSTSICDNEVKSIGSNPNARDRSNYVLPVLSPVENLTQRKTVKAKTISTLRPQKENHIAFSTEPCLKESCISLKSESEHEIPVDASFSNWLIP